MNSKTYGYDVKFYVKGLSLHEQQNLYNLLMANLTYTQKDNFTVEITDSIGGKHNIINNTGMMPDKTLCTVCNLIDCNECPRYSFYLKK